MRGHKPKLFDTSGGLEKPKRKRSRPNGDQQDILFGASTLHGLDRQGGLLTTDEAAKIPRRNKSGKVTRVPASVMEQASKRLRDASTKLQESKSDFPSLDLSI